MSEPIKVYTTTTRPGSNVEEVEFDPQLELIVAVAVKNAAWHTDSVKDPWVDGYVSDFVFRVLLALGRNYELRLRDEDS